MTREFINGMATGAILSFFICFVMLYRIVRAQQGKIEILHLQCDEYERNLGLDH